MKDKWSYVLCYCDKCIERRSHNKGKMEKDCYVLWRIDSSKTWTQGPYLREKDAKVMYNKRVTDGYCQVKLVQRMGGERRTLLVETFEERQMIFKIEFNGCEECPHRGRGTRDVCREAEFRFLDLEGEDIYYPDWCPLLPEKCADCRSWASWETEDIGACLETMTCGDSLLVAVYGADHSCGKFERRDDV